MREFTQAQWAALFTDQKHYVDGMPFVYSYVRGIGTVWVPVWFSDLPPNQQPMKDGKMASVDAMNGAVELWFKVLTSPPTKKFMGFQVIEYGHPAYSGPGQRGEGTPTESVIYPPSQAGLKRALAHMKRDIERRGGLLHGKGAKKAAAPPDEDFAEQLELYIVNTREIYDQHYVPVAKNLARKRYRGTYDQEKAIVAMKYIVAPGLKGYLKEVEDAPRQVSQATKDLIAKNLLDGMQELINDEVQNIAEKSRGLEKAMKPSITRETARVSKEIREERAHEKPLTEKERAVFGVPEPPRVTKVEIMRAEGPNVLVTMKWEVFPTMAAASAWLRSQAHTFPQTGGYDKHDLKVTWDDGETYAGRLDCQGLGLEDNDLDVKQHITSFLKGIIRPYNERPGSTIFTAEEAEKARQFLNRYMEYAE